MLFDRKIKYVDYYENGERLRGGGFVKLEVRNGFLNMNLHIKGLYPTDSFVRDVVISGSETEAVLGQITLQEGAGCFSYSCEMIQGIGSTGISYEDLREIKIPVGGSRELCCTWEKIANKAAISAEPQGKEELERESPEPEWTESESTRPEGMAEVSLITRGEGVEAQTTEGQGTGVQKAKGQGTEVQETEGQVAEAQETEGQGVKAQETEDQGVKAQETEGQGTEAQGIEVQGEANETEIKEATAQEVFSRQQPVVQQAAARELAVQEAASEPTAQKAETQTTESQRAESQTTESQTAEPQTTEFQRAESQTAEPQRAESQTTESQQAEIMGSGFLKARSAVSVTERQEPASQRMSRRNERTVPDSRISGVGGQQENKNKPGQKPAIKLLEDKWQQLSAIYPHIRPFNDEREYLSLSPSDFVLFPESYYRAANNSFLLHGFYNYKHLILTRVERRSEVRYYLGVPGNYYEREKQVAVMFGFESFECDREPAKTGDFGYYLMRMEL